MIKGRSIEFKIISNPKDLRKLIRSTIDNKYKSVNNFSKLFGYDQSNLNKYLVGNKDIKVNTLFSILNDLELKLAPHEK